MTIKIARFILALVAASVVGQVAHARASATPDETHQATGFDISGAVFTPLFSDDAFDAVEAKSLQSQKLDFDTEIALAEQSVFETGGLATAKSADHSRNHSRDRVSLTGGVWLFLGGIWIIGTLVHHRQTIHTS